MTTLAITPAVERAKISEMKDLLSHHPDAQFGDQERCPLKHSFGDGLYMREIFMPKDMVIVSKIHKFAHPFFIMKGKVLVKDAKWQGIIEAPYWGVTPVGTQRVLVILEDTTWVTVHANPLEERDTDILVGTLTAKTFEELPEVEVARIGEAL